jgi:hypothetical protein
MRLRVSLSVLCAAVVACGTAGGRSDAGLATADAGAIDAGPVDSGADAGFRVDAGFNLDAGESDGGEIIDPLDAGCEASGAACHALTQLDGVISEVAIDQSPPTATGGTLMPGTYVIADVTLYTGVDGIVGPTGNTISTTIEVHQTTGGQTVDILTTTDCGDQRQTLQLSFANNRMSFSPLCPAGCTECTGGADYTATATTLALVQVHENGTQIETFTKQ